MSEQKPTIGEMRGWLDFEIDEQEWAIRTLGEKDDLEAKWQRELAILTAIRDELNYKPEWVKIICRLMYWGLRMRSHVPREYREKMDSAIRIAEKEIIKRQRPGERLPWEDGIQEPDEDIYNIGPSVTMETIRGWEFEFTHDMRPFSLYLADKLRSLSVEVTETKEG